MKKGDQITFYTKLGHNIRSSREKRNLKQEAIATHLGLTRISISNIETGKQKIQLHALVELAEYLKVSILELLPALEFTKTELSTKLEQKISRAEISDNANTVERVKDFIRLSTSKPVTNVPRQPKSKQNRTKGK